MTAIVIPNIGFVKYFVFSAARRSSGRQCTLDPKLGGCIYSTTAKVRGVFCTSWEETWALAVLAGSSLTDFDCLIGQGHCNQIRILLSVLNARRDGGLGGCL